MFFYGAWCMIVSSVTDLLNKADSQLELTAWTLLHCRFPMVEAQLP